ncbi:histone-lysine N-methyltransferase family member SUVH9-like protein [Tanacetum coccineum]
MGPRVVTDDVCGSRHAEFLHLELELNMTHDVSHTPNPNPNPTPIATVVPHDDVAGNNNVLSEYNRIQELFRTAFPAKLEQQQTFDDVTDTKSLQRSSELLRVTNLAIDDEMYFRGVVRKTRMIYDSLRVLVVIEDDKRRAAINVGGGALVSHARGDLKAASVMKDRGLWLNRDKRIVGVIPGVHVGDIFFFRMELCVVGMHGQAQAGIDYLTSSQSFKRESIVTSVIVSGGYEDDEDASNVIVYTGHGGKDKHSRQVVHQSWIVRIWRWRGVCITGLRSRETGWGVRSLELIQAGSFICEYTRVVLTRYQAKLFTMNEDALVYPNRFGKRWAEWGDLSQIFTNYVRLLYPSIPPLDYGMDVSRVRNLACYMSHSACLNVLVQLVLYEHSHYAFPHLMLFAMENIPPLRELSLDYEAAPPSEASPKLAICN